MKSIGIHKHKLSLIPLGLLAITLLSGYFLTNFIYNNHTNVHAATTTASVTIEDACTMTGSDLGHEHTTTIIPGQYDTEIGMTTLRTVCNDNNGFSIYAVGFSNDTYGNTNMIGTTSGLTIPTAPWSTSSSTSLWSMKLIKEDNTDGTISYNPNNLTIENNYNNYKEVPNVYTKVASYTSRTDNVLGSILYTTYAANTATSQAADTYIGKVKYSMVHPSSQDNTVLDMQDLTLASCSKNVVNNIGDPLLVRDVRDDNFYTVRYINGNCWMTQNLRFTGTTMDYTTSNVAPNYTPESPYIATYYSLDGEDESYDGHCNGRDGTANAETGMDNSCIKNSGNTMKGVWYNYAAVSAGTITGDSNTAVAAYSICPAGWHIPTGAASTEGREFYGLFQNTAWQTWIDTNTYLDAFDAVPGGRYYNGSFDYVANGYWWSATAYNATGNRYRLGYNSSNNQFVSVSSSRTVGNQVRCVLNDTMQNFDITDAANLAEGSATVLADARDGKEYTVKKINGRVWMTQNLAFTGTTLTPSDSNVATDTTMTYYSLDSADSSYTDHCDNATNGYANACIKDSGNSKTGVWYNYMAATANTISGGNSTAGATNDICPFGWHIPTGPSGTVGTDFYGIFQNAGNDNGVWREANSYSTSFDPVAGGRYYHGSLETTQFGVWWSSTATDATIRYAYNYRNTDDKIRSEHANRQFGFFVRCIFGDS